MSEPPRVDRLRALATRVVETLGGIPAVRTLVATLEVYDGAGGGLTANGLAYSALIALIPGALLVAGAIGLFITDPAVQQRLVDAISAAVPPLAPIVQTALDSVAQGAVPTTVIALIGLLWGSSRFYASLDYAFSKVFHSERRRNEVVRTLRGLVVTFGFVALPIAALLIGSVASWVLDTARDGGVIDTVVHTLLQLATPIGSFVLFVGVVSLVYRFVPVDHVPWRAILRPAILIGIGLAGFAQLFTFIAPKMVGFAALFGTFVTIFALLAWMAISFNMLILGASWTRVRAVAMSQPGVPPAVDEPGKTDAREAVDEPAPRSGLEATRTTDSA
jgi:YihY family inner membrane protein